MTCSYSTPPRCNPVNAGDREPDFLMPVRQVPAGLHPQGVAPRLPRPVAPLRPLDLLAAAAAGLALGAGVIGAAALILLAAGVIAL